MKPAEPEQKYPGSDFRKRRVIENRIKNAGRRFDFSEAEEVLKLGKTLKQQKQVREKMKLSVLLEQTLIENEK